MFKYLKYLIKPSYSFYANRQINFHLLYIFIAEAGFEPATLGL